MAREEIKCNENGPELVVVDGKCLPLCAGVARLIANRIAMEPTQKLGFKAEAKDIVVVEQ